MTVLLAQSDAATAYGWGQAALWEGLCSGRTALRPTDRFDQRGFVSNQAGLIDDLAPAPGQSRVLAMLTRMLAPLAGRVDPDTPLLLATTIGEIEYVEQAVLLGDRTRLALAHPQCLLAALKRLLGLRGPGVAVSSACASSAAAVAQAASMIRHGQATQVLVVAGDAVTEFLYSGFSGLLSLSAQPARPFDAGRDGLSLGEAAAWALLTGAQAESTGGTQVLGWASTCDAVHMTAPDRDARGLAAALRRALRMSGVEPGQVGLIVAHGTATSFSDAMELAALRQVLPGPRPTISIKGGIGHTCGATGLIQVLVAARALACGQIPPSVGLTRPDPAAADWVSAQRRTVPTGSVALSMNSGFGGVNTVLVLRGGSVP